MQGIVDIQTQTCALLTFISSYLQSFIWIFKILALSSPAFIFKHNLFEDSMYTSISHIFGDRS